MICFYCIDSNIKKQNLFCSAFVCLPETSLANMVTSTSKGYGSNECVMPVGAKSGGGHFRYDEMSIAYLFLSLLIAEC